MQHLKPVKVLQVLFLITLLWTGTIGNPVHQSPQPKPDASRLSHIVEDVAQALGYRSMRGTPITDQWAEGEKQGWLVDSAHITLFEKDSDDSCVGIDGRIGVTILAFKDAKMAERHIAMIKQKHSRNIGFEVIQEGRRGYLIKEVNGSYAVLLAGGDVLILEDRSRRQTKMIKAIADEVARKTH
jgi:hypothetical protein